MDTLLETKLITLSSVLCPKQGYLLQLQQRGWGNSNSSLKCIGLLVVVKIELNHSGTLERQALLQNM